LVLLSTIHRIKGREWDHVVIFDVSRDSSRIASANDEEGERRVFHVALTRARTQVVALADADAPSIFLAELDGTRVRPVARPPTRRARRQRPRRWAEQAGAAGEKRKGARGPSVFTEVRLPSRGGDARARR
jgi:ATP-dependent exoDNAse (exonuclease V) beta subunit